MSKVKNQTENSTIEETSEVTETPIRYNKPSSFAPSFIGKSPQDLNPKATKDSIPQKKIEDVIDQNIAIHGYIKLQGEDLDKNPKDYVIMCCSSLENPSVPFTVISGNTVIVKKMIEIGKAKGFSIAAKIIDVVVAASG